jgi:clan AA aspartic protease (TIGR02281 family)
MLAHSGAQCANGKVMRDDFLEPDRGGGLIGWALRQIVIWLVGGFTVYWIVTNYGLTRAAAPVVKPQVENTSVEAAPETQVTVLGRPVPSPVNSLTVRAQPDGYAYVRASVNGLPMVMAFDTGASFVALTQADALKAGVAGNLNYSVPIGTANCRNMGAPVKLREIRIGQLVIEDVNAIVLQNLNVSLLGQTFLSRLHSYQMQDGVLTLTWQ